MHSLRPISDRGTSGLASLVCAALCLLPATLTAQVPEQYPKPLIHTPDNHPAAHVVLLNIPGLHAFDLANFVATHPHSALATLSARGITFTNAHTPVADPFAGLAAIVTGGTPISNGIVSGNGFDRAGGDPSESRVNTIFEVVHEKIGLTAWAGDDAATVKLLRGASGSGLDQACVNAIAETASASPAQDAGLDGARFAQLLTLLAGRGCDGSNAHPVPALSGMTFAAFALAQRKSGYADALGTPTPALSAALEATDARIGELLSALERQKLSGSTWIALVSPTGASPIDPLQRRSMLLGRLRAAINKAAPGSLLHITGGASAMLWFRTPAEAAIAAPALSQQSSALGIARIRTAAELTLALPSPLHDARMPDVLLDARTGVFWTTPDDGSVIATGGNADDDLHVALLVAGARLSQRMDPTPVPTTQLAPLLLRAFGLEKFDLQALHVEHTPALPGIF